MTPTEIGYAIDTAFAAVLMSTPAAMAWEFARERREAEWRQAIARRLGVP